jgi:hypothetical protein
LPTATATARPKPLALTFEFNQLRTLNKDGQPQRTFKAAEEVEGQVVLTVKHLVGTAVMRMERSYFVMNNGTWTHIATNVDTSAVVNGSNVESFRFLASALHDSVKVAVRITIGSETRTKSTVIHVILPSTPTPGPTA